jgi:homoserine kinase
VPSVTVRVPASTANLGSGYDAFGLALARYNRLTAEPADQGDWRITVTGEGEQAVRQGRDNLVAVAMRRLFDEVGEPSGAVVSCTNDIAFGRGLGSSAAAIVAGLVAANALTGSRLPDSELFRLAVEIEGHPDNVAATLSGGFTICWTEDGLPRTTHIDPAGGLAAVCVVSTHKLPTRHSRMLLPDYVPHEDAAFGVGRAGLLAAGLALGRHDLIGPGMSDRLHEPYRAVAVTDLETVRAALLEAGADGAALSGAGPTVIGLVGGSDDADALVRAQDVARRAAGPLAACEGRLAPEAIAIDRDGAVVEG